MEKDDANGDVSAAANKTEPDRLSVKDHQADEVSDGDEDHQTGSNGGAIRHCLEDAVGAE